MKTFYRDEYKESLPQVDEAAAVCEVDYDALLQSPLMEELHRIASEYLGNQTFTITQLPGVTREGKKVTFSSYSFPDSTRAKFCSSVYDLGVESRRRCQSNYSQGITQALSEGRVVETPCRFQSCMTCCVSSPLNVNGIPSGYWRFRSIKHDRMADVDFDAIAPELAGENRQADLSRLREEYEEQATVDASFFDAFQDYLTRTLGFLLAADLERRVQALRPLPSEDEMYDTIIQVSSGTLWQKAASMAEYKNSHLPIIIEGESGTGKEIIARSIHDSSLRKGKPFVVVPCTALPLSLIEAELFGYKRGAFSGAIKDYKGFFERADGGTLMLDDVAELPLSVQSKLLRVLEDGTLRRIGDEREIQVDLRIMIATSRSLKELADRGEFLKQLYYRVNSIHIPIPPVRENPEDILIYAQAFLDEYNRVHSEEKSFTSDVIKLLRKYHWPGNIRQIRIVVHQAAQMSGKKIRVNELPAEIRDYDPRAAAQEATEWSLAVIERIHIQKALDFCGGNVSGAAKLLGINRSTIYEKLKTK